MGILTNIPSNIRRPGAYHEFKFNPAGQGLVPLDRRVVIVAEKSSAGTATASVPVQIFDEDDADEKAGKSSLGALMCRKAFAQAKLSGKGSPEIWFCAVAEPGAGTAAVYTLTFSGPATESGDVVFTVAGRTITVGVSSGDTANAIAAATEAELDEQSEDLPCSASVAGAVVTLTFPTKGVNGNDLDTATVKLPAGVGLAHANPTPGAGAADPTAAIAALYDQRYHGICFSNHVAGDAAAILADAALAWGYAQKSYRFYAMGENGTLGTAGTLQDSYNDYRVLIVSCEGSGSLPGEMATAAMTAWMAREKPNANLDGEKMSIYPPAAASAYTSTEIETALAGGVIPLTPDGAFTKLERLVTSQITLSGADFEPLREAAAPRTAAYMAEQIDIGFRTSFFQEVLDDDPENDITQRVRDMVIEKHRAAQREHIIRDVDDFLEEIQVEIDQNVEGRLTVSDPFRVAGPLHTAAFVHTMYL